MPIVGGVIGFRAGGGGAVSYTVLGEPPVIEVVQSTVAVELQSQVISIDVATGEIEVILQ